MERLALAILLVFTAGSVSSCAQGADSSSADAGPAGGMIAVWDGGEIDDRTVEEAAGGKLLEARQQLYDARVAAARKVAVERVLKQRAEAAGKDPKTLREELVAAAVESPDDEAIAKILEQYRGQLPDDDEQARARVRQVLEGRAKQKAQRDVESRLLRESGFRILLEPPRVDVAIFDEDMTRGPEDAAVRIVEFTDYQCPYCGRAQATLDELKESYGDKLQFVFKDLPLDMHPNARMAAEAARCAGEQGAFWELHDWLFENARQISRESILQAATDLELDSEELAACLDEGRHTAPVDATVAQAKRLGVASTPTFYVNGRMVRGAQPYEAFAEIVEDELSRAGSAQ